MELGSVMYPCFVCSRQFEYNPGTSKGHYVKAYEIVVCRTCYLGNWNGWHPKLTSRLIAHLQENGLPIPPLNARKCLPRDG